MGYHHGNTNGKGFALGRCSMRNAAAHGHRPRARLVAGLRNDWEPMPDAAPPPPVRPSERITVTNEVELEEARLRSVLPADDFPSAPGSLSLLDEDIVRAKRIARYVTSIGSLEQVPLLVTPLEEIDPGALDPRAAFVLSQVDGRTSLDAILDVSAMSAVETLRIVWELARREIIAFPDPPDTTPVTEWRQEQA